MVNRLNAKSVVKHAALIDSFSMVTSHINDIVVKISSKLSHHHHVMTATAKEFPVL